MKFFCAFLVAVLIVLQLQLHFGERGLMDRRQSLAVLQEQKNLNRKLELRNGRLAARLEHSEGNQSVVEETARKELGMIKRDETFFWLIPEQ